MNTESFAPALLPTTRAHLTALAESYMTATGLPPYVVGRLVRADGKWAFTFPTVNFRVASYDEAVQAFSAIWPEGLPWPDDVPRQEPARLTDAQRALLAEKIPQPKESC